MHSTLVFLFALLAVSVNAHFQLQYPPPRGVFDEDNEPTFCGTRCHLHCSFAHIYLALDGYLTAVTNRSQFPLSGGFFSMNSEHPQWTGKSVLLFLTLQVIYTRSQFSGSPDLDAA